MKSNLIAIAAAVVLLTGCSDMRTTNRSSSSTPRQFPPHRPVELIEFHATWCGPCRQQKPIVERLRQEYTTVKFRIVDVDEDRGMAARFRVSSIPRIVILIDGRIVDDFEGLTSYRELRNALEAAIQRAALSTAGAVGHGPVTRPTVEVAAGFLGSPAQAARSELRGRS